MKNIINVLIITPFLLICISFLAGCGKDSSKKEDKHLYIYVPGAEFHPALGWAPGTCNNQDYPYTCSTADVCCGYQYYCASDNLCHSSNGVYCESGFETCTTHNISITNVTQPQTSITTGTTVTYTIYFSIEVTWTITTIIWFSEEIEGYYEIPVSPTDSANGYKEITMGVLEEQPDPSICSASLAGCSSYQLGGCWCAQEVPSTMSNANIEITLLDNEHFASPSYSFDVGIGDGGGDDGGGSDCDLGQWLAPCPEGPSRCCSENMECCYDSMNGGAIGCQFSGFCEKDYSEMNDRKNDNRGQ